MKNQYLRLFKIKLLHALFLSICINSTVFANDANKSEEGSYLNLSATEITEVEQDLLITNLRYEIEGESSKDIQNKINQNMRSALDKLKSEKDIEVSTGQYSVYKFYKSNKKNTDEKAIWHGSQSIILKSKNAEIVLELLSQLQIMGFVMSDLHYEISPGTAEEIRNSMTEEVINKLLSRAKKIANIIGAKEIKIKNINIDGDNRYNYSSAPVLMKGANTMGDKIELPVSAPGKTNVNLTISATILLKN